MRYNFLFFALLICTRISLAQGYLLPFEEYFDNVIPPALPQGWSTTANRLTSGDFTTTTSAPFSGSAAAISSNAAVEQSLVSPLLDFSSTGSGSVTFVERRSSTHNSGLILEASIDGGVTFPVRVTDTLKNPGVTSYVHRTAKLPPDLDNQPRVALRWRIVGDGSGTTGTLRIDDVAVTAIGQTDAAVTNAISVPHSPGEGEPVTVVATIRNAGSGLLENVSVIFSHAGVGDSVDDSAGVWDSRVIDGPLLPNDTSDVRSIATTLPAGARTILVRCALPGDRIPSNDTMRVHLEVGFPENTIVVNEILYEPQMGRTEYVELFNRAAHPVDIAGWKLSDVVDTSSRSTVHHIVQSSLIVRPREYFVVAADSSLFSSFPFLREAGYQAIIRQSGLSLNNDGDNIILYDPAGHTCDSVSYLPAWHNPMVGNTRGRSLERISPDLSSHDRRNWSTSADPYGGTPGKANSLFVGSIPSHGQLSFSPNPFSPDGDGIEDVVVISYETSVTTGLLRARIFDSVGRIVRILADGEPAGSHGELIWNGCNDRGERVRMGIYVVLLETSDGLQVYTAKGAVVVAAKMR